MQKLESTNAGNAAADSDAGSILQFMKPAADGSKTEKSVQGNSTEMVAQAKRQDRPEEVSFSI